MKPIYKLSICMMVKNEEKYLDKSLSSLKPLLESVKGELIIVDTGSEDKTVEIARRYTDKVYFHQWNNNFGDMRNKTISYATGEWVLVLDGDEVLQDAQPLIDFLNSQLSNDYNTGIITIKNLTREDNEDLSGTLDMIRLFRNAKDLQYRGAIHEQPHFKEPIFFTKCLVIHYGYLATDKELMKLKFKRNTALLEKELEEDPENVYTWFQLSQSYGMYKDFKKSLEYSLKAYNIAKKNNINLKERMYIYIHLAQSYYLNDKFKDLESICLEGLMVEDGHIDLYYFLAKAQKFFNKNKEAIDSYQKYIEILEVHRQGKMIRGGFLTKASLEFYEDVYLDLCILFKEMEAKEEALKYAKKITKEYMLKLAIPHLVELYVELNQYEDLYIEYNDILKARKEVQQDFWFALENIKARIEDEQGNLLTSLFSRGDCSYALLNKIRLSIKEGKDKGDKELIATIKNLDFETLPVFFADIIYFALESMIPIGEILYNIREYTMQVYVEYLSNKYKNLSDVMVKYLEGIKEPSNLNESRFQKILMKSILILDQVDRQMYSDIWNRYLNQGIKYITEVYNPIVIENESIYDVKSDEDAFLLYMLIAKMEKENNELRYVKYLRKALKVYPTMKKGIELLIKEIELEEVAVDSNTKNEFEQLKENVKKNIEMLLAANKAMEARTLIDEYLTIVPKDLEMLLLKSQVHLEIS